MLKSYSHTFAGLLRFTLVLGLSGCSLVVTPNTKRALINTAETQNSITSSKSMIEDTGSDSTLITVTLKDTKNLPIADQKVNLVSDRALGDTITPLSPTTNPLGQAIFSVTSTLKGSVTFTAYQIKDNATNLTVGTLTLEVAEPQVSYTHSTITKSNNSINNTGTDTSILTVTLKSSNDTPIQNQTISLTSNRNTVDTITPINAVTNDLGQAMFSVSSTLTGTALLTAYHVDAAMSIIGKATLTVEDLQVNYYASTMVSSKNSIESNNIDTSTITITLKSANNIVIPAQTVSLISNRSSGDTITTLNAVTNSAGQAAFTVSSTDLGTMSLTAYHMNGNNAVIGSLTLTVAAPQVNYTSSNITSSKSTIENTGTDTSIITVTLKSANNTVLAGETVSLTSNRGASDTITATNAITNASGQAIFNVTSSTLGSMLLTALHVTNNNSVVGSLGVTVTTPQPSYTNSSVISSKASIENTGADASTITVTLRSSQNTFLAGETISLTSSRAATDTITTLNATTNASGQATFTLASQTSGSVILTAKHVSANNATIGTVAVTVSNLQANYANSSITSSKNSIENTGTDASTITVTLRSSQNTLLSGQTVSLVSSRGVSDTITITNALTNSSGQAIFQLSSTTVGSTTLSAYHVNASNALIGSTNISIGIPQVSYSNSTIISSKNTIQNIGTDISTITVTLKSANNTFIQGTTVSLVSSRGASDTLTTTNAITNALGQAVFTIASSNTGVSTLSAYDVTNSNNLIGTINITVADIVGNYAYSSITSSKSILENTGLDSGLITVTLKDINNTALAGQTVSVSSQRGATETITTLNAVTNASGQATFQVVSSTTGSVTLTAYHTNVNNNVIASLSLSIASPQPSAGNSSITSSKSSIENTGNDSSTITVTLKSANNTTVAGKTVSLTSNQGSADTITTLSAITDALGQASFSLASTTTAGSTTLSAYFVDTTNILMGTLNVTVAAPQVSYTNSTITASKSLIENTGSDISVITVTLKSPNNTLIAGKTVSLGSSRGAGDTVTPSSAVTDSLGQASFSVSSTNIGTALLTAYDTNAANATINTLSLTVILPQVNYNNSAITGSKSTIENTGTDLSLITVTLKSALNTLIAGKTISLISDRGAVDTITAVNSTTNASGQAIFNVSSTNIGTINITAYDVNANNAIIGTITITVALPQVSYSNSSISSTKNTIENTGTDSTTLNVILRSSNNTPIQGKTVSLISQRGAGDTITTITGITDGLGQATFSLTSTSTGSATLTAYDVDTSNATIGTTSITVTEPQAYYANSSITSSKISIENTGTDTSLITVTLRSITGTVVQGQTVTITSNRGSGDTITTLSGVTNASGQATFNVSSTVVGTPLLSAQHVNASNSTIGSLSLIVQLPQASYANSTVTTTKSTIEGSGSDISPVTVTLLSINNTPVTGQTISLTSNRNAVDTITAINAITNASGQATFNVSSTSVGSAILTASHTNASNASIGTLNITVVAPLVSPSISTASSIYYYSKGDSVSISANNSGGNIVSCGISPSLPAGLSLVTSTSACQITGTVNTPYGMATLYTITATNTAGSGSANVNLSVIANTHSIGAGFGCAHISSVGSLKCWGYNNYSQLGDGTTTSSPTPLLVSGFNNVIGVGVGIYNTCVLLSDRTVKCWGYNGSGQLGNGTTTNSTTPVTVTGLSNVLYIAGGLSHHCALLQNSTIKCWGTNASGELGNGTNNSSYTPTTVTGITNAVALAVGRQHNCALLSDTTVKCWGQNANGQLGDGTTTSTSSPVTVTGLSNVTSLEGGQSATCAVLLNGTVKCWGISLGLGNGLGTNSSTPVSVSSITNAVNLTMGVSADYGCALLSDATVKCWGNNSYKSLADGTTTARSTPVTTLLTNVQTLLAGGSAQGCAILNDSTMRCWGKNDRGQVGDGTPGAFGQVSDPATVLNIP